MTKPPGEPLRGDDAWRAQKAAIDKRELAAMPKQPRP